MTGLLKPNAYEVIYTFIAVLLNFSIKKLRYSQELLFGKTSDLTDSSVINLDY